ncbi:type I restriction-modification system subunit M N-terminal domain-containing protein, partial [Mycoplasma buteonis]
MDNKKEQERDELHKTIWNIADNLRGQVDGWEFKSYVLVTMFYRYISESLVKHINAIGKRGLPDFDYAALDDSDPVVRQNIEEIKKMCLPEKGYFMYPS